MARRTGPRTGGVQATMNAFRDEIEAVVAEKLEDKLSDISYYATHDALSGGGRGTGVDTGAYVTSFSIGRAGFSGGRMKTSDNKPTNQNPDAMKQGGYSLLLSDIQGMNIKEMVESGNTKFTLRNRSTHARDVEDGQNWSSDGYHVFAKIRSKFG
jgi:hypothetical protein